jgi:glyoxylase-like metal-dependent hydrolase (beta-lactamase superfamily II)
MIAGGEPTNESVPPVTAEGEALVSDPRRLRYVELETPPLGGCVELTKQVSWMRVALPIDLNHINVWLIDIGESYIAVDTGMSASMCKDAWEQLEIAQLKDKPLRGLFITHAHPDHLGLAQWMQARYRIPVWMSQATFALAQSVYEERRPKAEEIEAFLSRHGVPNLEPLRPMFKPERFGRMTSGLAQIERFIGDGELLQWGGTSWEALQTDGHAEGHLCLYAADAKILISGDQVLPTISSNISVMLQREDTNPLRSYLSSLDRLRALPADTLVLPSHGRPFFGLQQRIDDLKSHHYEQLNKLLKVCNTPATAFELLPTLFKRELAGMHFFLALGEAVAHLEMLAFEGKLRREESAGVTRYVSDG